MGYAMAVWAERDEVFDGVLSNPVGNRNDVMKLNAVSFDGFVLGAEI